MRRCSHCQGVGIMLYRVPEEARTGPHPPDALCYFCFLHLVKRRPKRPELLPEDVAG